MAIAKGVLMQHVPGVPLVDISHHIETFNVQQAAYVMLSAYPNFPKDTCHVLLFDIFHDASPRLLLCEYDGQYLLGPDNGILSLAFGEALKNVWLVCELSEKDQFLDWLQQAGRVAAQLQTRAAEELRLPKASLKVVPHHWQPVINGDSVECHVIHIDRYENVVVNLTRAQFDEIGQGRPFRIQFMRDEELTQISNHAHEVGEGQKLCRFNGSGFLEICINRGKAASLFGFKLHREKHFIYNTIKVYFG